jgi:hypothetical protein
MLARVEEDMSIRRWHVGKLIILWSWGVLSAGLAITHFVGTAVSETPILHGFEIIFVVLALLVLTAITWHWLGSEDSQ